ncbi:hypothetical protein WJX73_006369 [Symbiochloris irregularis]|uniref:Uncharacterized protein n=1 Tax=Symbiochloris irregularis TaxID=706552 RepID=A0AAW1PWI4_9CHLO
MEKDTSKSEHRFLDIPTSQTTLGFAIWQDASEQLFEICMDCYLDPAERVLQPTPQAFDPAECALQRQECIKKALEYFNMPLQLSPPGVRMGVKSSTLQKAHANFIRKLVCDAVEIMEMDFTSMHDSTQQFSEFDATGPLACFRFQKKEGESDATAVFCATARRNIDCNCDHAWNASAPCFFPSPIEQQEMILAGQALHIKVSFVPESTSGNMNVPAYMKLECRE